MTRTELVEKFRRGELVAASRCEALKSLSKTAAIALAKKMPHIKIGRIVYLDNEIVENYLLGCTSLGEESPKGPVQSAPDMREHQRATAALAARFGAKLAKA